MSLWTTSGKRLALLTASMCLCISGRAMAQCTSYTVANGPATFISGTTDTGNHGDDVATSITLPFPVTLYSTTASTGFVCSNGFFKFGATANGFTNACPLTATSFTGETICPHWDDLRTDGSGQGIFTATIGSTPNRTFVIEWRAGFFSACTGTANFEILFYEGQSNFDVIIANGGSCSGSSATCGVTQGVAAGSVTQFATCNTAVLPNGTSLRFTCVAPSTGACCDAVGNCTAGVPNTSCTGTNTFAGAGSVCTPNPCTALLGACCASNGGCSSTTAAGCVGTAQAAGSLCSPNPCPQPPANDDCPGTLLVASGGTASVNGSTLTASTTAGASSGCGSTPIADVWYEFVPDITTNWTANLCGTNPAWDSVLSIHTACPGTSANQVTGACNDDNCSGGIGLSAITTPFALTAGTHYWVRVAGYPTIFTPPGANRGNFVLVLNGAPIGRCCSADGLTCTIGVQTACTGTNTWTTGLTCGSACPLPSGQCCAANGGCTFVPQASCTGTWTGTILTCTPNTCVQPSGSCCAAGGACSVVNGVDACVGGTFLVAGSCTPNICPLPPQACCDAGGCCTVVAPGSCTGTVNPSLTCTAGLCGAPPANDVCTGAVALTLGNPVVQSNCLATTDGVAGTCTTGNTNSLYWSFTAPYTSTYTASTCGSTVDTVLVVFSGDCNTPVQIGCNDDFCGLQSTIATLAMTAGQTYLVRVSSFAAGETGTVNLVITANNPGGSCCNAAVCTPTDSASCTGTFNAGGVCTPNPCSPPGVCCRGATCNTTILTSSACSGSLIFGQTAGAEFRIFNTCNPNATTNAPCCFADYNKAGGITVQDIFDFLADWFAGSFFANTGGNGNPGPLGVQNIFDFLTDWFAGGCVP